MDIGIGLQPVAVFWPTSRFKPQSLGCFPRPDLRSQLYRCREKRCHKPTNHRSWRSSFGEADPSPAEGLVAKLPAGGSHLAKHTCRSMPFEGPKKRSRFVLQVVQLGPNPPLRSWSKIHPGARSRARIPTARRACRSYKATIGCPADLATCSALRSTPGTHNSFPMRTSGLVGALRRRNLRLAETRPVATRSKTPDPSTTSGWHLRQRETRSTSKRGQHGLGSAALGSSGQLRSKHLELEDKLACMARYGDLKI